MNVTLLGAYAFGFYLGMASMFYFMTVNTYLNVVKKPWHVRYYVLCVVFWWGMMYDMIKDKKI